MYLAVHFVGFIIVVYLKQCHHNYTNPRIDPNNRKMFFMVLGRQGSRTRSVRAWSATRSSPTFGRRLIGSAARVGGTFTLSCDVNASPSPVTSWYRLVLFLFQLELKMG